MGDLDLLMQSRTTSVVLASKRLVEVVRACVAESTQSWGLPPPSKSLDSPDMMGQENVKVSSILLTIKA